MKRSPSDSAGLADRGSAEHALGRGELIEEDEGGGWVSRLLECVPVLSYYNLPVLCVPPHYWPFSWPRRRGWRAGTDYSDYDEGTHEKRTHKVAARQFIIENDLSGFSDLRYLPEAKNGVIRLIYLSTITSIHDGKVPYTRSVQDIFKISSKADFWTMLCLNLAMVFVPLFGLVGLFSCLAFVESLDAGEITMIPAALSAFFLFLSGLLSIVSTGTNPHFASVAANEKQNSIVELESDFASLAIDLLKMYVCEDPATKDFARRIARRLKISVLQDLLAEHTEWNLTEPLREAKRFILHKNVCFHSTIIRTYLKREHRQEIKKRKALSKAENYFKKLNIPTPDDEYLSSELGCDDEDSESASEWETEGPFNTLNNSYEHGAGDSAGKEIIGDELV